MSIVFSKALLMSGEDYRLTPSITLHHPTVGEIIHINDTSNPDQRYWQYINILLSDPYSNMVMLDDMGLNFLEVTPYDVFIIQWDKCVDSYNKNKEIFDLYKIHPLDNILDALSFFIKEKHDFIKGNYDDGEVCFYDKDNPKCQINKEIFNCIYEWVKSINRIDYSDRIKPADENARLILIEDMRDEIKKAQRRKKKDENNFDHLGNIMSANCFGGKSWVTPFQINDCKIYWLNEGLFIDNKRTKVEHILNGIYCGTISQKDVNRQELDWVS